MATAAVYTASQIARAASLLETSKTWTRGTRKKDGLAFVLFPSSKPGHAYYTNETACSCPGYFHRGACAHELAVRQEAERVREEYTRPRPSYEDLYIGTGFELTDAF